MHASLVLHNLQTHVLPALNKAVTTIHHVHIKPWILHNRVFVYKFSHKFVKPDFNNILGDTVDIVFQAPNDLAATAFADFYQKLGKTGSVCAPGGGGGVGGSSEEEEARARFCASKEKLIHEEDKLEDDLVQEIDRRAIARIQAAYRQRNGGSKEPMLASSVRPGEMAPDGMGVWGGQPVRFDAQLNFAHAVAKARLALEKAKKEKSTIAKKHSALVMNFVAWFSRGMSRPGWHGSRYSSCVFVRTSFPRARTFTHL